MYLQGATNTPPSFRSLRRAVSHNCIPRLFDIREESVLPLARDRCYRSLLQVPCRLLLASFRWRPRRFWCDPALSGRAESYRLGETNTRIFGRSIHRIRCRAGYFWGNCGSDEHPRSPREAGRSEIGLWHSSNRNLERGCYGSSTRKETDNDPDLPDALCGVILKRAYLKGTKEAFPIADIVVEGSYDPPESICIHLTPLKVKPGRDLVGKLIFVDQFNDKHVSEKITFRPNTVPSNLHANQLRSSPNCVFCNQPVTLEDQAKEAQMTAHNTCIWR